METITKKVSTEFSSGNFKFTFPHLADNVRWNVVGGETINGKEKVIEYCTKMHGEMANSKLTNTNVIEAGNQVTVQGQCDYVGENSVPGQVAYCDVFRFESNKLLEITSYTVEVKK